MRCEMYSQVLAVFCLFVLRLGIPLMVMLALGVLLGQ